MIKNNPEIFYGGFDSPIVHDLESIYSVDLRELSLRLARQCMENNVMTFLHNPYITEIGVLGVDNNGQAYIEFIAASRSDYPNYKCIMTVKLVRYTVTNTMIFTMI